MFLPGKSKGCDVYACTQTPLLRSMIHETNYAHDDNAKRAVMAMCHANKRN